MHPSPTRETRQTPRPVEALTGLIELPRFYFGQLCYLALTLLYVWISFELHHQFALYVVDPLPLGLTKVMMLALVSLLELFNILMVVRLTVAHSRNGARIRD